MNDASGRLPCDATGLVSGYINGTFSPVDAITGCLQHIKSKDQGIRAFVCLSDTAIEEARASADRYAAGRPGVRWTESLSQLKTISRFGACRRPGAVRTMRNTSQKPTNCRSRDCARVASLSSARPTFRSSPSKDILAIVSSESTQESVGCKPYTRRLEWRKRRRGRRGLRAGRDWHRRGRLDPAASSLHWACWIKAVDRHDC